MRHNNVLPNGHFHKDWQKRVKTWFDQPGQKKSRREARIAKAAKIAPRPIDGLLRPAVRGQTIKYNIKLRSGRGFTLAELKAAGIRVKEARSIGIAVDHRRINRSQESLDANIARLNEYKSKLVVFPKNAKKPAKADSPANVLAKASQLKGALFPVVNKVNAVSFVKSVEKSDKSAYSTLRKAWVDKRYKGLKDKKFKEKQEEEKNKK